METAIMILFVLQFITLIVAVVACRTQILVYRDLIKRETWLKTAKRIITGKPIF
jgi:hypothetical protein